MAILRRVTFTGADDSVDPHDLARISEAYKDVQVEWGILMSATRQGTARYPSIDWLRKFAEVAKENKLNVSIHICGSYVRSILRGDNQFFAIFLWLLQAAQRIQLNVHSAGLEINLEVMAANLISFQKDIIFQYDSGNFELMTNLKFVRRELNRQIVPLFDQSGGKGIAPETWPQPSPYFKENGYAGGIGPENLTQCLNDINAVIDSVFPLAHFWIDQETGVRSNADLVFNLGKVEDVLRQAREWKKSKDQ